MQTAPFQAVSAAVATLVLVACGASRRPADEPSTTTTTGVSVESGPATPGDPAGLTPSGGPSVNSAAPATPMEGNCPSGGAPVHARDRADCTRHCRGLDEAVPIGSRCVSSRVACEQDCEARYRF
jgi:hypothetical protein